MVGEITEPWKAEQGHVFADRIDCGKNGSGSVSRKVRFGSSRCGLRLIAKKLNQEKYPTKSDGMAVDHQCCEDQHRTDPLADQTDRRTRHFGFLIKVALNNVTLDEMFFSRVDTRMF